MNVVGHQHVSPHANAKVSCAPAIFDKGFVQFGCRQQACASVSIKCYKVDWRSRALEKQIQSSRLIFKDSLHARFSSARRPERTSSEILNCSVRCSQRI